MFAQQQLGRGQLFTHKASYRIADIMGRGIDGSDRLAIRKRASDAAIFADLDPGLKGRVLQAAKRSANGMTAPEDQVLESEIESMLEDGSLEPSVALLRIIHTAPEPETGFQVLNPSLSTRTDGGSDDPDYYYDNKRPSPGKRAGDREFMDLVKGCARSHGIALGSPHPRGALDLLRASDARSRARRLG